MLNLYFYLTCIQFPRRLITIRTFVICKIQIARRFERLREASHIDFAHEKRHMDVGGWRVGGLAPVTFLGEKS